MECDPLFPPLHGPRVRCLRSELQFIEDFAGPMLATAEYSRLHMQLKVRSKVNPPLCFHRNVFAATKGMYQILYFMVCEIFTGLKVLSNSHVRVLRS